MHKRRLLTLRVVGMAILVTCLWTFGMLASDGNSPAGDTTTPPAANTAKSSPNAGEQITTLKQQMALQQKQIEQMQKVLEQQKQLLEQLTKQAPATAKAAQPAKPAEATEQAAMPRASAEPAAQPAEAAAATQQSAETHAPGLGEVASTSPIIPQTQKKKVENATAPMGAGGPAAASPDPQKSETEIASPLQFKVGEAYITPVGFMDFTGVFRNHDAGTGIGTNFASIPYGTTSYQNNLTETRFSMQNSRVGFRVDADVHGAHVLGYMEADFLGTTPGNLVVSSNSNTMRSRLYWVDVERGKFEILGGQTWSLLTPGRKGISGLPSDVFYTQNMDVNYQAGLFWGRIPELRFVYHPTKHAAWAFAIDSPQQYAGGSSGGPVVTFPSTLSSTYSSELETGSVGTGVPNVAPDFITKLALDPSSRVHFEIGGIERNFKLYNPTNSQSYTTAGGGGFLNLHVEVVKGLRLLTNNFWSDGGGRYIFGQAPDLIARNDGSPSLIHAGSTVSGFEYTNRNTLFYGYYGGIYVARNVTIDASTGNPVGYGYSGSANTQNRSIQEATFGIIQTFWKDAKYGALSLITQYSYETRNPWSVAAGQPSNASLNSVYVDLRYTLPGSAPTMGH